MERRNFIKDSTILSTSVLLGPILNLQSCKIISPEELMIGWSTADITPDKPTLLAGQMHARVSEGILDPLTITVLALESLAKESNEKVILISCDLLWISDGLRDGLNNLREVTREKIVKIIPDISKEKIILNATHTHTAPYCNTEATKDIYGIELDVIEPYEYLEYVAEIIANAAVDAWNKRNRGGFSYGLSHAVTGHNRIIVDFEGKSTMYGNPDTESFSHVEGFEDHAVNLLFTWNKEEKLTGIIINIANPSQVSESIYSISSDFWHEIRVVLRHRLGNDIYIFPQCSAAADISPHLRIGKKAEERMQKILFSEIDSGKAGLSRRKQIAVRIADAVTSVLPYMKDNIEWTTIFQHKNETIQLSRRFVNLEDVKREIEESEELKKQFEKKLLKIKINPFAKQNSRWYADLSSTYFKALRGISVKERFDMQQVQPQLPVEIHVIRLGDIVIASNPFELYLDYGKRIKARSPAIQTFLVQLAGGGTYIPTQRSISGGAYGSKPASTLIGPEGGQELVEKTLEMINKVYGISKT